MNFVFTPTAWKQYTEWQTEDRKMVKRINDLIKDIDRNGPLKGSGYITTGQWPLTPANMLFHVQSERR